MNWASGNLRPVVPQSVPGAHHSLMPLPTEVGRRGYSHWAATRVSYICISDLGNTRLVPQRRGTRLAPCQAVPITRDTASALHPDGNAYRLEVFLSPTLSGEPPFT